MAKDQKPADQMDAFSKQAMAQAHEALDVYFDFLKKSVFVISFGRDGPRRKTKESGCSKHHSCARTRQKVESGEGF